MFSLRKDLVSSRPACSIVQPNLAIRPDIFNSGWTRAVARNPRIGVTNTVQLSLVPAAVSVRVQPPSIKTRGFSFSIPPESVLKNSGSLEIGNRLGELVQSNSNTRIRPPQDVIRLKDRLFYVLQPPLESLLQSSSLAFPFEPFSYQLDGIAFLYPRHEAILADEMGLGKTMQAITSIRLLLCAGEVQSVLLICPKPLISNWQREFSVWAPEIPVSVLGGNQTQRRFHWQNRQVPVKIANYELLSRDRDLISEGKQSYDLVILDEAQRIKNKRSTTSQVVRSIQRRRSWALTGTPIENSADDLVGIFEFLSSGFLSPEMTPRRMGRAAADYILRRTKDQVLTDLPPKMYRDADLDLLPDQRIAYELAENDGIVRLTEMGQDITIQHVFELVLRLKQVCNFDPATQQSSKLERLEADLEEVAASGQKALVFSQWVNTLDWLQERLAKFNPLAYHGKIPSARRDSILREFREKNNCHVLLLSYGAGGVGLNLQFAGYVFLFDRWWNPAVEDQAINRAHRIGSTCPVTVTRFLTRNTIEERIDQILSEKREVFDAVMSQAGGPSKIGLNRQDIFSLFDLKTPKGSLSKRSPTV